jgi:hypothetical protein
MFEDDRVGQKGVDQKRVFKKGVHQKRVSQKYSNAFQHFQQKVHKPQI